MLIGVFFRYTLWRMWRFIFKRLYASAQIFNRPDQKVSNDTQQAVVGGHSEGIL